MNLLAFGESCSTEILVSRIVYKVTRGINMHSPASEYKPEYQVCVVHMQHKPRQCTL